MAHSGLRSLPPLAYLQAFEAAARHRSFTKAAEELNCTQAAISQRIRSLETMFGQPLFDRLPNGVRPTDIAETYQTHIAEALDQLTTISGALAGPKPVNRVVVAVPVTFAALWLAPRLGRFYAARPDIEVRLDCTIWNTSNAGLADLQIRLLSGKQRLPNVQRLTQDWAHVVCAPELRALRDGAEPGTFFETLPLINLIAKYDYWDAWLRHSGAIRIGNGRRIDVDTGVAALEIARRGNGVALSLQSYIDPYLKDGTLVMPFDKDSGVDLDLCHVVIAPPERPLSRAAQAFQEFLRAEAL